MVPPENHGGCGKGHEERKEGRNFYFMHSVHFVLVIWCRIYGKGTTVFFYKYIPQTG